MRFPRLMGVSGSERELLEKVQRHAALPTIEHILNRGANPNARHYGAGVRTGYEGYAPLHYAAGWRGDGGTRHDLVSLLLQHGADPNVRSKYGHTPLHNLSLVGDVAAVKATLDANAKPNIFNAAGHTALHNAAGAAQDDVVECLLASGFDVNAQRPSKRHLGSGYTPLHSAACSSNDPDKRLRTVRLLIEAGADLNRKTGASPVDQTPVERARAHLSLVEHSPYNKGDRRPIDLMKEIIGLLVRAGPS